MEKAAAAQKLWSSRNHKEKGTKIPKRPPFKKSPELGKEAREKLQSAHGEDWGFTPKMAAAAASRQNSVQRAKEREMEICRLGELLRKKAEDGTTLVNPDLDGVFDKAVDALKFVSPRPTQTTRS